MNIYIYVYTFFCLNLFQNRHYSVYVCTVVCFHYLIFNVFFVCVVVMVCLSFELFSLAQIPRLSFSLVPGVSWRCGAASRVPEMLISTHSWAVCATPLLIHTQRAGARENEKLFRRKPTHYTIKAHGARVFLPFLPATFCLL